MMSEEYWIDSKDSVVDFIDYFKEEKLTVIKRKYLNNNGYFDLSDGNRYIVPKEFGLDVSSVLNPKIEKKTSQYSNDLIFGKNKTEGVTAVEVVGDKLVMFLNDGSHKEMDHTYWLLAHRPMGKMSKKLDGDLHYNHILEFTDPEAFSKARGITYAKKTDTYHVYDANEAAMIYEGITPFKGLKVNQVSVLSFDIESSGVAKNEDSQTFMITNTFRDHKGKVIRKLFSLDQYETDTDMIADWCRWVQEIDPSIMVGHNIFHFDLPYLSFCSNSELPLGKDCSEVVFSKKPRKFRKDGSQAYDYHNAGIFGRQVIDTMFLSMNYDFSNKYDSYGLKQIIAHEIQEIKVRIQNGEATSNDLEFLKRMERPRTFWDFEVCTPKEAWEKHLAGDSTDWERLKEYGADDADDGLILYDLMIPQYFYYNQSLSMPFQTMNNTATGRQINGFLVRAYLQQGHSLPKASEERKYQGAISFGIPGLHNHVTKVDVASLYPSIMITDKIFCKEKDPNGYFLQMVEHFTAERLQNKKTAKETGDRYYKDLEQAQKIVINSAYGLLGTGGLNFNYFDGADMVTARGREILQKGIEWVCGNQAIHVPRTLKSGKVDTDKEGKVKMQWCLPDGAVGGKGFSLVNVDTDSFSYSTGKKLTESEFKSHIAQINSLFPEGISWEDDGYFKKFLVIKTKNYVMVEEGQVPGKRPGTTKKGDIIKIKGSGLKGTMKELALQEFMRDLIMLLLAKRNDHVYNMYMNYVREIQEIQDMTRWAMKKTVTEAVLNPERAQEQKVLDAISGVHYQEGDKFRMFSLDKDTLKLVDEFNGEYDQDTYFNKLYNTLCIFETVLDPSIFPNFKTGRNKVLL